MESGQSAVLSSVDGSIRCPTQGPEWQPAPYQQQPSNLPSQASSPPLGLPCMAELALAVSPAWPCISIWSWHRPACCTQTRRPLLSDSLRLPEAVPWLLDPGSDSRQATRELSVEHPPSTLGACGLRAGGALKSKAGHTLHQCFEEGHSGGSLMGLPLCWGGLVSQSESRQVAHWPTAGLRQFLACAENTGSGHKIWATLGADPESPWTLPREGYTRSLQPSAGLCRIQAARAHPPLPDPPFSLLDLRTCTPPLSPSFTCMEPETLLLLRPKG